MRSGGVFRYRNGRWIVTAIVFGSAQAQAILQRDRMFSALEDMAVDNADGGFWVFYEDLTPDQRRVVQHFIDVGLWEDDEGPDADRLCRPNEDERDRLTAEYLQRGQQ